MQGLAFGVFFSCGRSLFCILNLRVAHTLTDLTLCLHICTFFGNQRHLLGKANQSTNQNRLEAVDQNIILFQCLLLQAHLTVSCVRLSNYIGDQGYGRGGTPVFTGVFKPLVRVTLYLTDENGLGSCFGAA